MTNDEETERLVFRMSDRLLAEELVRRVNEGQSPDDVVGDLGGREVEWELIYDDHGNGEANAVWAFGDEYVASYRYIETGEQEAWHVHPVEVTVTQFWRS